MLSRGSLRAGVLPLISLLLGCGDADNLKSVDLRGQTMGTGYSVVGFGDSAVSAEELQVRIESLLEEINDQMSTYRADSEVSRFNRYPDTDWFEVSEETAYVVDQALIVSRASSGAFDITVQPLVALWGFDSVEQQGDVPDRQEILTASGHVGFEGIAVRPSPPAIRKGDPDMRIDLSGIAKGYGVDRIAGLLDGEGLVSYLVEIGGELRARGHKPDGSPWKVAVERPLPDRRRVQRVLGLSDAAVATSGDYRNYFERDGTRYAHILDPHRGVPAGSALVSVTVVARRATYADAMATALMVLGPNAGIDFALQHDIAAFFLIRSDSGLQEHVTPPFERYLLQP